VRFELVQLEKRTAVEEKLDALARGHPATLALAAQTVLAAAKFSLV